MKEKNKKELNILTCNALRHDVRHLTARGQNPHTDVIHDENLNKHNKDTPSQSHLQTD